MAKEVAEVIPYVQEEEAGTHGSDGEVKATAKAAKAASEGSTHALADEESEDGEEEGEEEEEESKPNIEVCSTCLALQNITLLAA